jgi:hypothetical protein
LSSLSALGILKSKTATDRDLLLWNLFHLTTLCSGTAINQWPRPG